MGAWIVDMGLWKETHIGMEEHIMSDTEQLEAWRVPRKQERCLEESNKNIAWIDQGDVAPEYS